MGVLVVNVLEKILAVFCLADDKDVIHKPKPHGRGVGKGLEGFDFKLFHEDVSYERADGGSHSCTLDLFIILTLEEEVGVGKTELQQGSDLGDGHGSPLWKSGVLLQPVFNNLDGGLDWN